MLFSISHRTQLDYSDRISESVMEVRLMPRSDERQVLRQFDLVVTPVTRSSHHADWLGNQVHQFSVLEVHEQLVILSRCLIETRPLIYALKDFSAPLEGLVRDHRSWDFLQHHGPVTNDPRLPGLARQIGLDKARRAGEAIDIITTRTKELLQYRRGVTNSSSTVTDVLDCGAGVCQDFSHLALALLRRTGIPCRYVSGYLFRGDQSEVETHAWIEAFVPGVGWVGVDPTHGELISERHVTVAVGRSYADVPPNRGVYRGDAQEKIAVSVVIEQLESRARLSPYSGIAERPRPNPTSRPPMPRLGIVVGLEQQTTRPEAAGAVVQQQRQQQQ